jgi:hypothetical protein
MSMMKHYYLAMICVGGTQLEQEAIEYGLLQGWVKLKYNFDEDRAALERQLPELVEAFRREAESNTAIANQPMQEFIDSIATLNLKPLNV